MTKIRTSGGKITVTVGGNFTTYAKEDIVYNSQKTITFTGKENGITYGEPLDPPITDKITNTIVEFRTKQDGSYTGQFGFDWLRIDDNGLTTEKKYEDCLINGYEAPNGEDTNTE